MATGEESSYTLSVHDFDQSLLPGDAQEPGSAAFRSAIGRFFQNEYASVGAWAQVVIDDRAETIQVTWRPGPGRPDPLDVALGHIKRGDYSSAVRLLEMLRHQRPGDETVLFNLGMALSDLGRLTEAVDRLRSAIDAKPDHVNAQVALGVAFARQGRTDQAVAALRDAVALDDKNPWAHRSLGGCLLQLGEAKEAESHLRTAAELNPDDQQALFGHGQALLALGKEAEADQRYCAVIALNERTQVAELAKRERSKLAQKTLRSALPGVPRPDAVFYCLGAIERFERMPPAEVQRVAFEIALLGQRGINPNDSAQKYTLKSVPGTFSGLHLLCYMYVGFKTVAPDQDIGFDLSQEYEAAMSLHRAKGQSGED